MCISRVTDHTISQASTMKKFTKMMKTLNHKFHLKNVFSVPLTYVKPPFFLVNGVGVEEVASLLTRVHPCVLWTEEVDVPGSPTRPQTPESKSGPYTPEPIVRDEDLGGRGTGVGTVPLVSVDP